jgi:prepilin-type N-terminal cleavage/methylation domain-containing protein
MRTLTHRRNSRGGFTLIESLIVVTILAILGGTTIAAYEGLESQSAKGVATAGINDVDRAVRLYTSVTRSAPNNLDSLMATTGNDNTSAGQVTNSLGAKLAGKFTAAQLTADQAGALNSAGLTDARYIDVKGDDETTDDLTILAADGFAATNVGPLSQVSIPGHVFDDPRPGDGRNRGRGFGAQIAENTYAAIWNSGDGGYNNTKLGARDDDVLVGFGLGMNSSMVNRDDLTSVGNVVLSEAPFYADVAKNEYPRYILLYNVGGATQPRSKAKLLGVLDARGDFLDEEFAEFTGQKQ